VARLEEINRKSAEALQIIREIIDESLEIMASGRDETQKVTALWEEFLREFFAYLKKRSKETRRNLFSVVSFKNIWPR
jgi:hypothetical protein